MTMLLVALLAPLLAAILIGKGRPGPAIGCLCLMGLGFLIACNSVVGLVRQRA